MPAEALGFGFKLSSPRVISDSPHRQKSECSRESKPPRTGARGVGIAPWNRAQDCIGFAFGLSLPTKCEGSEILRWWGSEWLPRFPRQCRLLAAWLSTFRLKIAEEPSRARTMINIKGIAVQIPAGEVVEVDGEMRLRGLRYVVWGGKLHAMFEKDLLANSEPL